MRQGLEFRFLEEDEAGRRFLLQDVAAVVEPGTDPGPGDSFDEMVKILHPAVDQHLVSTPVLDHRVLGGQRQGVEPGDADLLPDLDSLVQQIVAARGREHRRRRQCNPFPDRRTACREGEADVVAGGTAVGLHPVERGTEGEGEVLQPAVGGHDRLEMEVDRMPAAGDVENHRRLLLQGDAAVGAGLEGRGDVADFAVVEIDPLVFFLLGPGDGR